MHGYRGRTDWRLYGLRGDSPLPLVDKSAATAWSWYIGAVILAVAVCAAIGNRETSSVEVGRVTLQTQRGLADGEESGVGRPMRGVATQTILRRRRMLVGERPPILRMTA